MRRIARITGGALLAVASPALAQSASDLMPPPTAAQQAAPYIPGVTPPAAMQPAAAAPPAGGAGAPAAAGKDAKPSLPENAGRGSFVYDEVPAERPESVQSATPPSVYVVKSGDTLSSIAAQYFGSPGLWPRLWAYNPAVTNPHWVFPGDTLHLGPPGAAPVEPTPAPAPEATPAPAARPTPTGLVLRQTGFVDAGELARAAVVVGSPLEKELLSDGEDAYLEQQGDNHLTPGARYTVYRKIQDVKHPVTGKAVGALVEILGEMTVGTGKEDKIVRATVSDTINPVERKDLVGPLRHVFRMVEPRTNTKDLDAIVLAAIRPSEILGSEMLAFIDRGKDDGLEVGNRFEVVRRGDGYAPRLARVPIDDKRFPREVEGEVLIIDVLQHTATGFVTRSRKEVRVGDRLEMRRGR